MSNKGCINCRHNDIGRINFNKPDTPHSCKLNHTEEFDNWWKENGHKKLNDESLTDMPCFEVTELDKILDSMLCCLKELKTLSLEPNKYGNK